MISIKFTLVINEVTPNARIDIANSSNGSNKYQFHFVLYS